MNRVQLLFLLVALLLAGCSTPQPAETAVPTPATFDRRAMLQNITDNIILPNHQALTTAAATLEAAAQTFVDDPTPTNLDALQTAWLEANLAHLATTPFRLGPVAESLLHNRIDRRPPRTPFIDEALAGSEAITETWVESVGSTSVGLGAMEYLIFDPVNGDGAIVAAFTTHEHAERRREYLLALAQNLGQKTADLQQIWLAEGGNYAQAFVEADMDGGDLQGSINMLTNLMLTDLEEVINTRLGKPSGVRSNGVVRPDLVEAAYSGASLPRIITTVETLQATFNGGDGSGFDDYLDFLGAAYEDKPLSQAINEQFETTLAALGAIEGTLETAVSTHLPQVNTAYEELRQLLVLLKVDMTNHLGITLTFNDNDGD